MARKASKPASDAADLFPAPKPKQDLCSVCRRPAHYSYNDPKGTGREHYCRTHVPEHFGLPVTLVRLLEDAYLAKNPAG